MASWQSANQGAQVGAQTGNPWLTLGLAALAGFMGKKPSWTTPQRQQMRIASQFETLGNAPALSQPDEQAALAQQLAALNQSAGGMQNRFFAAAGPQSGLTPEARADALRNLASTQLQDQGNARMQALLASFAQKRQALGTAAQIAGSVGPKGQPGNNAFPELLGQLAYLNTIRRGPAPPPGDPGGSDPRFQPGGSIWPTYPQPGNMGRLMGPPGAGAQSAPAPLPQVAPGNPMDMTPDTRWQALALLRRAQGLR